MVIRRFSQVADWRGVCRAGEGCSAQVAARHGPSPQHIELKAVEEGRDLVAVLSGCWLESRQSDCRHCLERDTYGLLQLVETVAVTGLDGQTLHQGCDETREAIGLLCGDPL